MMPITRAPSGVIALKVRQSASTRPRYSSSTSNCNRVWLKVLQTVLAMPAITRNAIATTKLSAMANIPMKAMQMALPAIIAQPLRWKLLRLATQTAPAIEPKPMPDSSSL